MNLSGISSQKSISALHLDKQKDLGYHSELAFFELHEIHDALDHVLDYLVQQNNEIIQEINRQTHINEQLLADVASYHGHIHTSESITIQEVFTEQKTETTAHYEIVRESITEIIGEESKSNSGDYLEHHRFTEKITTHTLVSTPERRESFFSPSSMTEKKKMRAVILLLTIAVIVLGTIILTH